MRAQEFIREEREEWSHMPDPTMQQQFDQWDQQKRGRNALTTMPVPKTDSKYRLGPDSSFVPPTDPADLLRNPAVAKELGFPKGWTENDPTRLTRKMMDPATGNIQLGPDEIVQPGTEEYAKLRRQTNPVTGTIWRAPRIPSNFSQEQEKRQELEVPNRTGDQGKKIPEPKHPMDKKYRMIDPRREKYRT